MRILKRNIQPSTLPARLVSFVKALWNIFMIFKQPLLVLTHYVRSSIPRQGYITTRSGYRITFSGHKHDLISTVLVFCKQDYGKVRPGSVCLDIGANTGVFALYAASLGAKKVYAFEANKHVYDCMVRNIKVNGLHNTILPFNLAVTDRTGDRVSFPVTPSPYNKIHMMPSPEGTMIDVETISLDDIVAQHAEGHVDMLQMDIEGAEYMVFAAVQQDTLPRIEEIRMEYHAGPLPALCEHLHNAGFQTVRKKAEQADCGIIWFRRLSG